MFPQMIGTTLEAQRSIQKTKRENDRYMEAAFERKRDLRREMIAKAKQKIAWGLDNMDSRAYPEVKQLCELVIRIQEHHLYGHPYPKFTAEQRMKIGNIC
jgi:hypothetical protein